VKDAKCVKCPFDEDVTPKELPLSDINLEGNEWNFDFFDDSRQDELLFGLLRLGGPKETEKS
jgi:hypothetical protein